MIGFAGGETVIIIESGTRRPEFKTWTRLFVFPHIPTTSGKRMNPIIFPLAMGN